MTNLDIDDCEYSMNEPYTTGATINQAQFATFKMPEMSDWQCYLFGSKPGSQGYFVYTPSKGDVPNWFVRWMMRVCLGCTWVHTPVVPVTGLRVTGSMTATSQVSPK